MMNPMKTANRFFLLFTAPFIGIIICLLIVNISLHISQLQRPKPLSFTINPDPVVELVNQAHGLILETHDTIARFHEIYAMSAAIANDMVSVASTQVNRPAIIYDRRITARLGTPAQHIHTDAIDLKLFYFNEDKYKGYAMKVKLKSKDAMKMVLGKDRIGESETTLEAVQRYGAIAGINAGGFADEPRTKKRYPLSTTVLDGKYVYGFEPSVESLTFIGLDENGKLIGGMFSRQEELDQLMPDFGATFVPILLKNGIKQPIPAKWLTSPQRAPRTIIGNYKDDQLLFIVTDGYNTKGSEGATLPEIQDKLIQFGVIDAYNLDGGGSSSLIWNDKIINNPSGGNLRPLATHFLFFK